MMSGKNPHHQRDELQRQWDLLHEKIVRLRTARIIETDTAILFKLDRQIEEAETEREKVAQQIDELEQQVETHQEQDVSPMPFSRKYSCLLKIGGVTVISIALITVVRSYKYLKPISTHTPLPSSTTFPVPSSSSEMTFASWCLKKDLLTMDEKHTVEKLLSKAKTIAKKKNLNCEDSQKALAQIPDDDGLDLTNMQIVDIKPLSSLNNLKSLTLRDNHIKDISALVHLTNLKYLNLSDNKIEDITPLKLLRKLTYLDLENNQIQEVTSLASLRELETLKLTNNNIRDVRALSSLKNLKEPLELVGNDIPITKQSCPVKMGCNF